MELAPVRSPVTQEESVATHVPGNIGRSRSASEASVTEETVRLAFGGRYVLNAGVRRGGQGSVFRARRVQDSNGSSVNDDVALKLYSAEVHEWRVDREVAAAIRHPNFARLVEHGETSVGGYLLRYVAWEWIDGEPLDLRLERGPLSPRETAQIGADICRALGELWSRTIVHRDVKPGNIVPRAGGGEAVLIDLGVARHLGEVSLTTRGQSVGTRGYMSPEQWRGDHALTCKSDMFSLGVVLLQGLAGQHPTRIDQELLVRRTPAADDVVPFAPAQLTRLIDRLLSPRAAFRPTPAAAAENLARLAIELE